MKKLFFIICVSICISCNSQLDKAIEYNNTLLKEQQWISSEIKSYLDIIKDTSQTERLEEAKRQLLIDIEESIIKVEKLTDFNGNFEFKRSVIAVLNTYHEGVKTDYDAIATYQLLPTSEKTQDKKWQAEQHAIYADEIISKKEDYFILMQQKFAKENNIDLD
ncbi:MAG: hypothetical protein QMC21_06080 [Flavobacteriales bacterium]|jgi:hypothetical protein|tara:strand:+ start:1765 stop:2253 length:489 start_codon:yes stop_codon:yes gene_type:complete